MKRVTLRLLAVLSMPFLVLSLAVLALGWGNRVSPALAQAGQEVAAAATARVWVAHLAPFSNTITGTSVTLNIAGMDVLTNVRYGDTSGGYVELPANVPIPISIIPTGSVTPAIITNAVFMPGTDYTVAAIGDGVNQPLELLALVDDNTAPPDTNGKVRIVHTAPFSNTPGTAVDVLVNDSAVLTNFLYKANSGYLNLPADTYNVEIALAGGGPTVLTTPLALTDGAIVTVFAIGGTNEQPVSVLPIVYATGTARVWAAHLAPFSSSITDTSVTINVNGQDVLIGVKYGDTSNGYLNLPAGVATTIKVIPTGSASPAITGTFVLTPDTDYTVAAIGDGSNQILELLPLVDNNAVPATGTAKLRVVHTAPFSNTLPGTAVDVLVNGSPVLTDFLYKANSGYLELPADTYNVEIALAGGGATVLTTPLTLVDGQIVSVFAIGGANEQPVSVLPVIYRQGATPTIIYLPILTKN